MSIEALRPYVRQWFFNKQKPETAEEYELLASAAKQLGVDHAYRIWHKRAAWSHSIAEWATRLCKGKDEPHFGIVGQLEGLSSLFVASFPPTVHFYGQRAIVGIFNHWNEVADKLREKYS